MREATHPASQSSLWMQRRFWWEHMHVYKCTTLMFFFERKQFLVTLNSVFLVYITWPRCSAMLLSQILKKCSWLWQNRLTLVQLWTATSTAIAAANDIFWWSITNNLTSNIVFLNINKEYDHHTTQQCFVTLLDSVSVEPYAYLL